MELEELVTLKMKLWLSVLVYDGCPNPISVLSCRPCPL